MEETLVVSMPKPKPAPEPEPGMTDSEKIDRILTTVERILVIVRKQ